MVLCTYCGSLSTGTQKCSNCGGHFDLLSRQRTQNSMGPWSIRDQVNPFHPGCSYDTLRRLVARGKVRPDTVMRGPTTRQFWSFARNTPGVAHLLGACHACHTKVEPGAASCPNCNASFIVANDRQHLGLAPIQMLPGDADPAAVADAAFGPADPRPAAPVSAAAHSMGQPVFRDEPAERDVQHTGSAAPTRAVRAPVRKRSRGPMIAVAASVGCAAVALGALVYMGRPEGNPASASAAEPSTLVSAGEEDQPDSSGTIAPSAAEPTPPSETQPIEPPAADPAQSEQDAAVVTEELPETEPDLAETSRPVRNGDGTRSGLIGSMTADELVSARESWARDGLDGLVARADRRLQQLELRSQFGE